MRYAASTKLTPQSAPPSPPRTGLDDLLRPANFFLDVAKQVGRKPFYIGLNVSKTLVDLWCSGEKRDVFTAAKMACEIVCEERRSDLIPQILCYIGGDYEGAVLNPEQTEALRVLAKVVK